MNTQPSVIVFDVNETLSNMEPMKARFTEVGAPAELAALWFAQLLRDGFALAAAGGRESFATIGTGILRGLLRGFTANRDLDDAVRHIMAGFGELDLHPDVTDGIRSLKNAGYRLVTLSNGSTQVAETLLSRSGLRSEFEKLLSVEQASAWKPVRAAYDYAADACGVRPEDMVLVAVHPWDIHGASHAGLGTAWLNRAGHDYPGHFRSPDFTVHTLSELANRLPTAWTEEPMKIEILHIDECANWEEAGRRAQTALAAAGGLEATIEYRLLSTPEDAAQVPFAGSPTILINGTDAFPGGGRTTDLACRVYYTDQGLAGLPTTEQLRDAFTDSRIKEGL